MTTPVFLCGMKPSKMVAIQPRMWRQHVAPGVSQGTGNENHHKPRSGDTNQVDVDSVASSRLWDSILNRPRADARDYMLTPHPGLFFRPFKLNLAMPNEATTLQRSTLSILRSACSIAMTSPGAFATSGQQAGSGDFFRGWVTSKFRSSAACFEFFDSSTLTIRIVQRSLSAEDC